MKNFKDFFNEDRATAKAAYLKGTISLEGIEKAFKNVKSGTAVKLTVKNDKSRSKQGIVTLMDIKKGKLLTTSLATSTDKSAVFNIDDVISYDTYKINESEFISEAAMKDVVKKVEKKLDSLGFSYQYVKEVDKDSYEISLSDEKDAKKLKKEFDDMLIPIRYEQKDTGVFKVYPRG